MKIRGGGGRCVRLNLRGTHKVFQKPESTPPPIYTALSKKFINFHLHGTDYQEFTIKGTFAIRLCSCQILLKNIFFTVNHQIKSGMSTEGKTTVFNLVSLVCFGITAKHSSSQSFSSLPPSPPSFNVQIAFSNPTFFFSLRELYI